jgi:predicted nucleotidyltransferase
VPARSLSSVSTRVWKVDREAVLTRISDWAEQLGRDPGVLAVVLFGSYARGDATAASDADVILEDCPVSFEDRISIYKPLGLGVSVEVFPYTLAEAQRSVSEGWGVVPPALREGKLLYSDGDFLDAHALP